MAYKVVVTNDAKENMQEYIEYILYEKKNQQAAGSLLDDFEYTKVEDTTVYIDGIFHELQDFENKIN